MKNRTSTLYQLDNALAEFHFAVLKAVDETSFNDTNQFIVSTSQSLVDLRREFENRYKKFMYPSMALIRSTNMMIQPHNNVNKKPLIITQPQKGSTEEQPAKMNIDVRPVTLDYNCLIIDYRKKYIDEYFEILSFELQKYAPRIDIKCVVGEDSSGEPYVVHNLTSIQYDIQRINIDTIPSYDDKTSGTGQIYVLRVPFTVDTQLLGNYQESKLIHEMIVNYTSLNPEGLFLEVDSFSTIPKNLNITEGNN